MALLGEVITVCCRSALLVLACASVRLRLVLLCFFFFFHDTATTELYTLSLHDALPICDTHLLDLRFGGKGKKATNKWDVRGRMEFEDRKSTRLNSSHLVISYAVFCLKKQT